MSASSMDQRSKSVAYFLVLLLAYSGVVCVKSQSSLGQCLTTCGQTMMSCAIDCATKQPLTMALCIQGCGVQNVQCMGTCAGINLPVPPSPPVTPPRAKYFFRLHHLD